MTWILEEPLYIAILGVVATAMLGFAWSQTRLRALLYCAAGTALLTILLLVVEHFVQTDAERVKITLHQLAAAVERNDLDAVLPYLSAGAPKVRAQARAEFPRYKFRRVAIKRNLEVKIDRDQTPPRAVATFNVVVVGTQSSLHLKFHVPRYVEVTLIQEGKHWRVLSYRHWDLQRGMQRKEKARGIGP